MSCIRNPLANQTHYLAAQHTFLVLIYIFLCRKRLLSFWKHLAVFSCPFGFLSHFMHLIDFDIPYMQNCRLRLSFLLATMNSSFLQSIVSSLPLILLISLIILSGFHFRSSTILLHYTILSERYPMFGRLVLYCDWILSSLQPYVRFDSSKSIFTQVLAYFCRTDEKRKFGSEGQGDKITGSEELIILDF